MAFSKSFVVLVAGIAGCATMLQGCGDATTATTTKSPADKHANPSPQSNQQANPKTTKPDSEESEQMLVGSNTCTWVAKSGEIHSCGGVSASCCDASTIPLKNYNTNDERLNVLMHQKKKHCSLDEQESMFDSDGVENPHCEGDSWLKDIKTGGGICAVGIGGVQLGYDFKKNTRCQGLSSGCCKANADAIALGVKRLNDWIARGLKINDCKDMCLNEKYNPSGECAMKQYQCMLRHDYVVEMDAEMRKECDGDDIANMARCSIGSDFSMTGIMGKNTHEWITTTTLLFAAAAGAIGVLGVVAAVPCLVPRQAVQQSRLLA